MKERIISLLIRQFRKPLSKIVMIVLGLPTFLVSLIGYLFFYRRQSEKKKRYVLLATERLKKTGELADIRDECEDFLRKKYEFFGKKSNTQDFQSELQRRVDAAWKEAIDREAERRMKEDAEYQDTRYISYLSTCLQNKGIFLLSVISSLPLYLFLLLSLNAISRYAIERLLMLVFVIFGVVFLVFTILHFSSSDPAINILGDTATEQEIASFNATYGLDKSYLTQLFTQFKRVITLNLGNSYSGNENVFESLMRKFPTTLKLACFAAVFGILLSLPLGILSSLWPNSAINYIATFLAMMLMALPPFWFGMVMILNFSIRLGWLPATFNSAVAASYLMPSIVMSSHLIASITRMTRSSMLEVLSQDYITTARAKGLSRWNIILRHALGNALVPIVTAFGLQFGGMLGGSAIVEKVFAVRGIGSYIIDKQYLPDIPVILSGVVYLAIVIGVLNLLVDLIYAVIDPRIKADLKKR